MAPMQHWLPLIACIVALSGPSCITVVTAQIAQAVQKNFTLSEDGGYQLITLGSVAPTPLRTTYVITELPTQGRLYDTKLNIASGQRIPITHITKVPFNLSSNTNSIMYRTKKGLSRNTTLGWVDSFSHSTLDEAVFPPVTSMAVRNLIFIPVVNDEPISGSGGHAVWFDGKDDVIGVPITNFPVEWGFTFEVWVKPSDQFRESTVFSYYSSDTGTKEFELFNLDNLQFARGLNFTDPSGISANDGNWHHIAVSVKYRSFDSSSPWDLTIYLDSAIAAVRELPAGPSVGKTGMLVLGQRANCDFESPREAVAADDLKLLRSQNQELLSGEDIWLADLASSLRMPSIVDPKTKSLSSRDVEYQSKFCRGGCFFTQVAYHGYLDEFRLYSRPREDVDIQHDAFQVLGTPFTKPISNLSLLAYLPFDDPEIDSTTTIHDVDNNRFTVSFGFSTAKFPSVNRPILVPSSCPIIGGNVISKTVSVDSPTVLDLPAFDQDSAIGSLFTRVELMPIVGKLFQVGEDGGKLAEITANFELITNSQRKIIYEPQDIGKPNIFRLNEFGLPFLVDTSVEYIKYRISDEQFIPAELVDPDNPPPDIQTTFLLRPNRVPVPINATRSFVPFDYELVTLPIVNRDEELLNITLLDIPGFLNVYSVNETKCSELTPPGFPELCYDDCMLFGDCPSDCALFNFGNKYSFHSAPAECQNATFCRTSIESMTVFNSSEFLLDSNSGLNFNASNSRIERFPSSMHSIAFSKYHLQRGQRHTGSKVCLQPASQLFAGDSVPLRNGLAEIVVYTTTTIASNSTLRYLVTDDISGQMFGYVHCHVGQNNLSPGSDNIQVIGVEDVPLTISLKSTASDPNSDIITPIIIRAPHAGTLFQFIDTGGDLAAVSGDFGERIDTQREELVQFPTKVSWPSDPIPGSDTRFSRFLTPSANAFASSLDIDPPGAFAELVCGELGVEIVEFQYEQEVYARKIVVAAHDLPSDRPFRVLFRTGPTNIQSKASLSEHAFFDRAYGLRIDESGVTNRQQFWEKKASTGTSRTFVRKVERTRDFEWHEVFRGSASPGRDSPLSMYNIPGAACAADVAGDTIRIEMCGQNAKGPGFDNPHFNLSTLAQSALLAGSINTNSKALSMVRDPQGRVVYVPQKDFHGTDSLVFSIYDCASLTYKPYSVSIVVNAANDHPTAKFKEISMMMGESITIQLEASDRDGQQSSSLQRFISGLPARGSLTQMDGSSISQADTVSFGIEVPVTDAQGRVRFIPSSTGGGTPYTTFKYAVRDASSAVSEDVTVYINVVCFKGSFLDSANFQCVHCDPGSFSPNTPNWDSACVPCPPGQFQNQSNSFDCVPCSPGTFASQSRQTSCRNCAAGSFTDKFGSVECTPCPSGQFMPIEGQTFCHDCGSLSYTASQGSTHCVDCPANSRSLSTKGGEKAICSCNKHYYDAFGRSGEECSSCPYGGFCQGDGYPPVPLAGFSTERVLWGKHSKLEVNMTADRLLSSTLAMSDSVTATATENSSTSSNSSLNDPEQAQAISFVEVDIRFVPCAFNSLFDRSCNGFPKQDPFLDTQRCSFRQVKGVCDVIADVSFQYGDVAKCEDGYSGRLCSDCANGYSRGFDGSCLKCPDAGIWLLLFAAVGIGSIFAGIFIAFHQGRSSVQQAVIFCQLVAVLADVPSALSPVARSHLRLLSFASFNIHFIPWSCWIALGLPSEPYLVELINQWLPVFITVVHSSLPILEARKMQKANISQKRRVRALREQINRRRATSSVGSISSRQSRDSGGTVQHLDLAAIGGRSSSGDNTSLSGSRLGSNFSRPSSAMSGSASVTSGGKGGISAVPFSKSEIRAQFHKFEKRLALNASLFWVPVVRACVRPLICIAFSPLLSISAAAPGISCGTTGHTVQSFFAVCLAIMMIAALPILIMKIIFKEFASENLLEQSFLRRFGWITLPFEQKYWWWPITILYARRSILTVAFASGIEGAYFLTASRETQLSLGEKPLTDLEPSIGLTIWTPISTIALINGLHLYLWPYLNKILTLMDVLLYSLLLIICSAHFIPPDLFLYSPANGASYQALSDMIVIVCFYIVVFVIIVFIRLDLRGSGLNIPPWLRYLLYHMFKGERGQILWTKLRKFMDYCGQMERKLLFLFGLKDLLSQTSASQKGDLSVMQDKRWVYKAAHSIDNPYEGALPSTKLQSEAEPDRISTTRSNEIDITGGLEAPDLSLLGKDAVTDDNINPMEKRPPSAMAALQQGFVLPELELGLTGMPPSMLESKLRDVEVSIEEESSHHSKSNKLPMLERSRNLLTKALIELERKSFETTYLTWYQMMGAAEIAVSDIHTLETNIASVDMKIQGKDGAQGHLKYRMENEVRRSSRTEEQWEARYKIEFAKRQGIELSLARLRKTLELLERDPDEEEEGVGEDDLKAMTHEHVKQEEQLEENAKRSLQKALTSLRLTNQGDMQQTIKSLPKLDDADVSSVLMPGGMLDSPHNMSDSLSGASSPHGSSSSPLSSSRLGMMRLGSQKSLPSLQRRASKTSLGAGLASPSGMSPILQAMLQRRNSRRGSLQLGSPSQDSPMQGMTSPSEALLSESNAKDTRSPLLSGPEARKPSLNLRSPGSVDVQSWLRNTESIERQHPQQGQHSPQGSQSSHSQ